MRQRSIDLQGVQQPHDFCSALCLLTCVNSHDSSYTISTLLAPAENLRCITMTNRSMTVGTAGSLPVNAAIPIRIILFNNVMQVGP